MKREDLKALNLADDVIDKIMDMNGNDVNATKEKLSVAEEKNITLTAELQTANTTIEQANQQMEEFKGMDIEAIKTASEEWKTKYEQSVTDKEAAIHSLKRESAISQALLSRGARNPKAVRALLNEDAITYGENGLIGLQEQLDGLEKTEAYLFGVSPDGGSGFDGKESTKVTTELEQQLDAAFGLPTQDK